MSQGRLPVSRLLDRFLKRKDCQGWITAPSLQLCASLLSPTQAIKPSMVETRKSSTHIILQAPTSN